MRHFSGRLLLMALALLVGTAALLAGLPFAGQPPRPVAGEDGRAVGVDLALRSLVRRDAFAESWEYETVVVNNGDQPATPFSVAIDGFECGAARGDNGVAWHDTRRVPQLAATSVYTVTWQSPLGCTWARAVADADRDLNDADRSDNTLDVSFRRPTQQQYDIGTVGLSRDGDAAAWRIPNGGRIQGAGFFGDLWFTSGGTSRTQAQALGTWSVSVPPGPYRLLAYIPKHGDLNGQRKPDAPSAVYQVYDQTNRWRDAVTIDQERFADSWVPLGSYYLTWTSKVRLGDNVGAPTPAGTWVVFDTIRAIPDSQP